MSEAFIRLRLLVSLFGPHAPKQLFSSDVCDHPKPRFPLKESSAVNLGISKERFEFRRKTAFDRSIFSPSSLHCDRLLALLPAGGVGDPDARVRNHRTRCLGTRERTGWIAGGFGRDFCVFTA